MPYMMIMGHFNTETKVGGRNADPQLMDELGAKKSKMTQLFTTPLPAQDVLNVLEVRGWRVVSMAAVPNGECTWTLHKESLTSPVPSAPPSYGQKFG